MNSHKFWFWLSLFVFVIALVLLVTGSPFLTYALLEHPVFPFGNLITWAGFVALPLSIFLSDKSLRHPTTKSYRILAFLLKAAIGLAVLWVPVCALLAGNLTFSFSEKASFQGGQSAMQLFWIYSYFLAAAPIILLLAKWGIGLFEKRRN